MAEKQPESCQQVPGGTQPVWSALAQEPGFISAALEASAALVVVCDAEGRIVQTNRACEQITGYSREELPGRILWDVFLRPEGRARTEARFQAIVSAHAASIFEDEWISKSGQPRRISFSNTMLPGGNGAVRYVIATGIDVTVRQRTEQEHFRSEAQFRLIWDATQEPMCLTDQQGTILQANAALARRAGRSVQSLEGVEISTLFEPADEPAIRHLYAARGAAGERQSRQERELHLAGGRSSSLEICVAPLEMQPARFLSIFRDVTGRKTGAEELAQAKETVENAHRDLLDANRYLEETGTLAHEMAERAAALSAAQSEFLSNMTHEIRTPLNGIMGMVDLAMLGTLEAEQREYLELAKSSANSLLALVNDVLDYARYEAGKLALSRREFSLRSLLQQVLGQMAERGAAKHLPLEWSVERDVPDQLMGDSDRLGQVLGNLAGNAIKFTPSGRVAVKVSAASVPQACSVEAGCVELHFTVSDTGIGVPREKQRIIFQPFTQADGSATRKYGGAGLGLSIASVLVELMGGRIWMESNPGGGSKAHFTVVLDTSRPAAGSGRQAPERRRQRILVAEDNIVNQRLATRLLEHEGYSVEVAGSGKQALEMLGRSEFDLVLMDIQMPELDGLEATAQIRRNERGSLKRLPIVAVTAQASESDRQRCFEAGMDAYVTKPVRVPELMSMIKSVVPGGSLMDVDAKGRGSVEVQLHHLDESLALSRVGGDFDLLREVVGLFLNDYPQSLDKIRIAVAAHDPSGVEHHAHSLKGSVSTFGAQEAFEAALELERKGRSGDLTNVEDGLCKLEFALSSLRPELEALQSK